MGAIHAPSIREGQRVGSRGVVREPYQADHGIKTRNMVRIPNRFPFLGHVDDHGFEHVGPNYLKRDYGMIWYMAEEP